MGYQKRKRTILLGLGFVCLLILVLLRLWQGFLHAKPEAEPSHTYASLPPDTSNEEPLAYIDEDFSVKEGFSSNLPIVILSLDGEITEYKSFQNEVEIVHPGVEEWTTGSIRVIESGTGRNTLNDQPQTKSRIRIKKRGHTSFAFDKSQYRFQLTYEDGTENPQDMLGMGEESSWILNGSMADKSMIRNYLSYRIAAESMQTSPDSHFCEVLVSEDGGLRYQGVYLLQETVSRSKNRVDIDSYNPKNVYTSYIVRRDRYTGFDIMLETYGRQQGFSPEWVGLKYPADEKLTPATKAFIEEDFSKIEEVIYSEEDVVFRTYDRYINMDSFVDYFLLNEFFGNYDAGRHSTYMYKSSGDQLSIGPVWDFDQAMNNYFQTEMETHTLAFQESPLFDRLCKDTRFLDRLKKRYAKLRKDTLSDAHVLGVIDESVAYLRSAREREWFRWAANYEDDTFLSPGSYYLQDYIQDGEVIRRFNDFYDQEIYNIKTYLRKHAKSMPLELTKLYDLAETNSGMQNEKELLLTGALLLFTVPAIFILRKK